ncbi:MAG TPA: gamma-glutamyl-gamma-aminobutyrate hydrolase family protein [Thermoanaerobaculia bacterium]
MIKPIIGIGADVLQSKVKRERSFAYMGYVEALKLAGAVPLVIPPQEENVAAVAEILDGILLAGGFDCDPKLYGEERHESVEMMDSRRQASDFALAKIAREQQIPALGICLGLQVMNVAAGGSLIQDIDSHVKTETRHAGEQETRVRHDITVTPGTRLASILTAGAMNVNSSHHQAAGRIGDGLRVTAQATDEVVEGIEDPRHPFYVGVQWHPEDMNGEQSAAKLFEAFVSAARVRAESRRKGTETSPLSPHGTE